MPVSCQIKECPVALTGKCVKSHSPIEECPHLVKSDTPVASATPPSTVTQPTWRPVYPGHELGLEQASSVMSARFTNLIGVLGETDAGKTCMLCSLYLLASCSQLAPAYRFAGSQTLLGFESRLRIYRDWPTGTLPDRITAHTEHAHPRAPGFLHLVLASDQKSPAASDFLFTDLPGEWTSDLVKSVRGSSRLMFLQRANGLVFAFRADQISSKENRYSQLQSARMIFQRIKDTIGVRPEVPIAVAITRCDLTDGKVPQFSFEISATAQELGFLNIATIGIASFSANPNVPSGLGIGDLLKALGSAQGEIMTSTPRSRGNRNFEQYQLERQAP